MNLLTSLPLLVAILLPSTSASTIGEIDLVVDYIQPPRDFTYTASISSTNILTIALSTNNTATDTLASLGNGHHTNVTSDYTYGSVRFHNTGNISEIHVGEWAVQGTLDLEKGVVAKISGMAVWVFDDSYTAPGSKVSVAHPTRLAVRAS